MCIASRRRSVRSARWWWFVAAAVVVAGGCQMPYAPPKAQPSRASSYQAVDPCAERLGDICSRLLLYYSSRRELPPRLEDLARPGGGALLLTCPTSGQAYLYYRQGLAVARSERRIVVQDSVPCHDGTRWVIAADPARPGQPRVIQVLRLSATAELSEK